MHKGRHNINSIQGVMLEDASYSYEMDKVKEDFVNHFKRVLNGNSDCNMEIEEVKKLVKHFFNSRHLLREVNCSTFALIPKCFNSSYCKYFRPIACFYVIYKCITKIMANRLKCLLTNFSLFFFFSK